MPGSFQSYRDLVVWQVAMSLAEDCYRVTRDFPREEMFGLTSQIRRAAASIPANIAEGHGRENTGSFVQFLRIAQGSTKELETHLFLAERVGLLPQESLEAVINRVQRSRQDASFADPLASGEGPGRVRHDRYSLFAIRYSRSGGTAA